MQWFLLNSLLLLGCRNDRDAESLEHVTFAMICFFCRMEKDADLMSYFRDPINFVLVSGLIALVFLGGAAGGGYPCLDGDGMPKEIFEGGTYGCERLEPGSQGRGVVYWVRVDLTAPGIGVYVTPKDPTAVSLGWQYRLRRIRDV